MVPVNTLHQARFMARRVTKDEISSPSSPSRSSSSSSSSSENTADQQREAELEIQRQLKYIHDYQQEIQDTDHELKAAIKRSVLNQQQLQNRNRQQEQEHLSSFLNADADIDDHEQEYYVLNGDELDEMGLDDLVFSDEVKRYMEMENEQQAMEAKRYSDVAMTAATNTMTAMVTGEHQQNDVGDGDGDDEERIIHSPVRGTMILDKNVRPPTLDDYVELLRRDLAQDMVVMNLRTKCTFAKYCIFVTGTSFRHMRMMANHVLKMLKERRMFHLRPCIEGEDCEDWMLVDGGDIYVQIFSANGREYYDLERKWAFQKVEQFEPTNYTGALQHQDTVQGSVSDASGTYSYTLTKKPQPGEIEIEEEEDTTTTK